jgi:hypothetical protein
VTNQTVFRTVFSLSLLVLLFLSVANTAQAGSHMHKRHVYINNEYLAYRKNIREMRKMDADVRLALKLAKKSPNPDEQRTTILALKQQGEALNDQIIQAQVKEAGINHNLRAYRRQYRNDGFRIKALKEQLSLLQLD